MDFEIIISILFFKQTSLLNKGENEMKRQITLVLFSMFLFLFAAGHAKGEAYRAELQGWTMNYSSGVSTMFFSVGVWDTEKRHAPDYVNTITITAPDTTQFSLGPNDWDAQDPSGIYYWAELYPADFIGGVIPSGIYTLSVLDQAGKTIKVNCLNIPVITKPTASQIVTTPTFMIVWNAVPGAAMYRLRLYDDTTGETIYGFSPFRALYTTKKNYTTRLGDLKDGHNYRVRIEARDSATELDNRSNGAWTSFTVDLP
jgi:hypothetical protein